MGLFNGKDQEPSEAFAAEEQNRADGLGRQLVELSSDPTRPLANSLPHYQAAYQNAAGNAAANTEQPESGRNFT